MQKVYRISCDIGGIFSFEDAELNTWYRLKIHVGHSDKLQCFKDICESCFVSICGALAGIRKI